MSSRLFFKPDLHMHSVFSDGTDTPETLIDAVKAAGIDLFSLTDHDSYLGCEAVAGLLGGQGPAFLPGIEFSCRDEKGKYHILGYGYDTDKPSIRDAAEITHNARRQKIFGRLNYLKEEFGFVFRDEDLERLLALENPGKPHIAKLMVQYGYAESIPLAFEYMKGYKGTERYLSPLEAIDAILHADGIPVLAHGLFGDGSQHLSETEIERRVCLMKEYGLMGLECYYSGFEENQVNQMLELADRYNLFITAGSDYHGKNKKVRLGDTGSLPDPARMERFYKAIVLMGKV